MNQLDVISIYPTCQNMPFYTYIPKGTLLADAGFGLVSHVPAIFDEKWHYQGLPSRYLRERALGKVKTEIRSLPTRKSVETFSRALCDFLDWCTWAKKAWTSVDYVNDIILGYQRNMQSGSWSAQGRPLAARTINLRVDEACLFLTWAAERQFRDAFVIPATNVHRPSEGWNSYSRKPALLSKRVGRVRPHPINLRIPNTEEVNNWLESVRIEKSLTKALMCELIVRTGIRREECAEWRVSTLPLSRKDWSAHKSKTLGNCVKVAIEYGAKGTKTLDRDGCELGPRRYILIPLDLAIKIDDYRTKIRPRQRAQYIKAAQNADEAKQRMRSREPRLFLSDYTGTPIRASVLYTAWTSTTIKPFAEWSPHLGRHYWACATLRSELEKQWAILNSSGQITANWINGAAATDILTIIKPQLGHVSTETVAAYLVWLQSAFLSPTYSDEWINALDAATNLEKEHYDRAY